MAIHPPINNFISRSVPEAQDRYTICLPVKQMKLLKAIMQNPLHENESQEEAALREAIFKAIEL